MSLITASSVNDLQRALCQKLLESGADESPRGLTTRELLGISFEIDNPRNRLTTLACRKWSPALAVAELAWHLRGDMNVEALAFYTPRWREFADVDGQVRGSCYGARIFAPMSNGRSQWDNVRDLLRQDRSSRRAVLNFGLEEDVSEFTNDLSCTNTIQFIVRKNKLHAFVNMRSNDVVWGVPYDVFLFTCLQELMAVELDVDLGGYHHYASSMHVYERHYELAARIAQLGGSLDVGAMPRMVSADGVRAIAAEESLMRLAGVRSRLQLGEFEEHCLALLGRHERLSVAA
jgi:thymidylate synthase